MADLRWDRDFALEQAGDDEELLAELLELLRQTTTADLEKGRAALAAGDGEALANAAHNAKGSAAGLGLESLRQTASPTPPWPNAPPPCRWWDSPPTPARKTKKPDMPPA